jgi:predicted house-cleaning noncanonical NTP pyrophosphatase (MazG superfamily)
MSIYNKLVRDRIPEIIEKSGRTCTTSILSQEEYAQELHIKLQEEVQEYIEAQNVEELADILEVLFALAKFHGAAEADLIRTREQKREERGGFEDRIFLMTVQE